MGGKRRNELSSNARSPKTRAPRNQKSKSTQTAQNLSPRDKRTARGNSRPIASSQPRKTSARRIARVGSSAARLSVLKKRAYDQTENHIKERISLKYTKGRKPKSSRDNVEKILSRAIPTLKKRASRKKAFYYTVRVRLRYKGAKGKWRTESLSYSSLDLSTAVKKLLAEKDFDSLTSGDDNEEYTGRRKIKGKSKRVIGVEIDKITEKTKTQKAKPRGTLFKTARAKRRK